MELERFSESVKLHRPTVFKIAYGYVRNSHDAEDVSQEVFLKLYNCEIEFYSQENVKAWLIRATINQSKSLLKSAWRVRRSDLDEETAIAEKELPEDCFELFEYVKNLKPKYRSVIYLYYYEGYSIREIAAILKIRTTTVTTQLNRARSQLKQLLLTEGFSV